MLRLLCIAALLWTPCFVLAGGTKDYPIKLKVLETDAISSKSDGTKITTTCPSNVAGEVTCDSTAVSAAQHTELVSFADAGDGKLYVISCVLGAGRGFLSGMGQSMQANAGTATVSGCPAPPGTYKAHGIKAASKLHMRRTANSKRRLLSFTSAPKTPPAPIPAPTKTEEVATRTLVLFSSVPPGAEIQMDGSSVGNTPSSISVSPGEHSIRITKSGYRIGNAKSAPWAET